MWHPSPAAFTAIQQHNDERRRAAEGQPKPAPRIPARARSGPRRSRPALLVGRTTMYALCSGSRYKPRTPSRSHLAICAECTTGRDAAPRLTIAFVSTALALWLRIRQTALISRAPLSYRITSTKGPP
jgi:hypothetical protein